MYEDNFIMSYLIIPQYVNKKSNYEFKFYNFFKDF